MKLNTQWVQDALVGYTRGREIDSAQWIFVTGPHLLAMVCGRDANMDSATVTAVTSSYSLQRRQHQV